MTQQESEPGKRGTQDVIRALPTVLLHDHLDGGLRPDTLLDLAHQAGHPLPADDPGALGDWFVAAASSFSLERYLETFGHTVAVMQTVPALARVAREAVLDLADDGVVYAELRFAPEQHQRAGLSLEAILDAVLAGVAEGREQTGLRAGVIVCAMRQADRFDELAALALAARDRGVVGFDLAGPEEGFPPTRAAHALADLARASFPVTLHAGEAAGAVSIAQALEVGAVRLGHGVRLVDDLVDGGPQHTLLGRLAHWVRDRRIALEVCPSSNIQTGAAADIAQHPVTLLHRLGFAVTVNTDNRLMSGTSQSRELALLVDEAGWTLDDVRDVTLTAARSSFLHHDEREALVADVILPAYGSSTGGRHSR